MKTDHELSELSEKAQKKAHSDWRENLESLNKNSLDKFCEAFKITVKDYEYLDRHYINYSLDVDDEIKELSGQELADYLRENYGEFAYRENCDRPFTGYPMDNVLLVEIWLFMEEPEEFFNFHRLIKECLSEWIVACAEDYAHRNEFHIFKCISSASNWRYTKDGRRI